MRPFAAAASRPSSWLRVWGWRAAARWSMRSRGSSAMASGGEVEVLTDARERLRHLPRRLVHDRHPLGGGRAAGPDDTEDAQHLIAVEVGGGDERAFAHRADGVLLADGDAHASVARQRGHEVRQPLLLLEGPQQRTRLRDVPELRVVEDVDGAADVERAPAQHGDDLLGHAARPRVQRVERMGGRVLHVHDLLDAAVAEPAGGLPAPGAGLPPPPPRGEGALPPRGSTPGGGPPPPRAGPPPPAGVRPPPPP